MLLGSLCFSDVLDASLHRVNLTCRFLTENLVDFINQIHWPGILANKFCNLHQPTLPCLVTVTVWGCIFTGPENHRTELVYSLYKFMNGSTDITVTLTRYSLAA